MQLRGNFKMMLKKIDGRKFIEILKAQKGFLALKFLRFSYEDQASKSFFNCIHPAPINQIE